MLYNDSTIASMKYNDLIKFIKTYDDCLDVDTILQLLQNNGKSKEAIAYAKEHERHECVINQYINCEEFKDALEFLIKIKEEKKRNDIMIKYAITFMKYEIGRAHV